MSRLWLPENRIVPVRSPWGGMAGVAHGSRGNPRLCLTPAATVPQYGANALANPGFEAVGGGGADVFGSWLEDAGDGAIARTTTAGEFRSGAAAVRLTGGATPGVTPIVQQHIYPTTGTWHLLSGWARGDGTNAGRYALWDHSNLRDIDPGKVATSGVVFAPFTRVYRVPGGCSDVTCIFRTPSATGGWACFDDLSDQAINLPSIISLAGDAGVKSGMWRCHPNLAVREIAGLLALLDSASNPLYYLYAYIDRYSNKAYMLKVENGVVSELTSGNVVYSAGAPLEIVSQGSTHTLRYNGAQVGTPQTVDTAAGYGTVVAGFDPQGGQRFGQIEAYV